MWEAIRSSVESQAGREQRKSFVENNSVETVTSAGMSSNMLIALSVMGLLVQFEDKKCSLEDESSTAQAVERSLRDRVSALEKQLYGAKTSNSGTQELKSLVADIRKMQFSIETIGKHTAKVARHFNEEPVPPRTRGPTFQPDSQSLPSIPESPNPSQGHPSPHRGNPANPRQPPATSGVPSAQPSSTDRGPRPRNHSQPTSRPNPPNGSTTSGERRNGSRQPTERPSTAPYPNAAQMQHPTHVRVISTSSSPAGTSSSTALVPRAAGQVVLSTRALQPQQILPPVPPSQAPRSWTLTALRDFTAKEPNQLSMKEGEKLYLFFTSDTNGDWIWCKDETGTTGYAPRAHVRVDNA